MERGALDLARPEETALIQRAALEQLELGNRQSIGADQLDESAPLAAS
jgi:hypothetical protein